MMEILSDVVYNSVYRQNSMAPLEQKVILFVGNFKMEVRVTSVNIKIVHVPMLRSGSAFSF